jgi:hypothetical protein
MEPAFLQTLIDNQYRIVDRAVALLWFRSQANHSAAATTREISDALVAAGYATPNPGRLDKALRLDPRTAVAGKNAFRLTISARAKLDLEFKGYLKKPELPETDSIIPMAVVTNTRGYIYKVSHQINASFDGGLHDCCAVMARRLLETLIIEVYEHHNRADELKNPDGTFKMFSGLLSHIEKETRFNIGRGTLKGLRDFKGLGDNSAHNRRFNATRADIEGQRQGLRVAVEELLHLAGLK